MLLTCLLVNLHRLIVEDGKTVYRVLYITLPPHRAFPDLVSRNQGYLNGLAPFKTEFALEPQGRAPFWSSGHFP